MSTPPAEPLSDWLEPAGQVDLRAARSDPGRYVCRWRPLMPVTLGLSAVILVGGYLLVQHRDVWWIAAYVLLCSLSGLSLTLLATAWGAVISLTESPRCGAWFVVFPPYMFYYAATRWRWMAQPSSIFLTGAVLIAGGLLAGQHLLQQWTMP